MAFIKLVWSIAILASWPVESWLLDLTKGFWHSDTMKEGSLILKQDTTHRFVERFWENLQKAGKDKLTPTYLKTRLTLPDNYWDSTTSTHMQILEFAEAADSEYCTFEQIETMEESYVTARARLQAMLAPEAPRATLPRARAQDEPSAAALMQQMLVPKRKYQNSRDKSATGRDSAIFILPSCIM